MLLCEAKKNKRENIGKKKEGNKENSSLKKIKKNFSRWENYDSEGFKKLRLFYSFAINRIYPLSC